MLRKAKQIIDEQQSPITSLKEFKTELHSSVKSIATENEEVQRYALRRVCDLLETNTAYLHEALIQSDTVDACVKELIQVCKYLWLSLIFSLIFYHFYHKMA